jgi:hypothetical protein
MSHAFIAYVHENREQAERLCRDLSEYGVECWFDRKEILPGLDWKREIKKAIEKCAFFIACFSKEYLEREKNFLNKELTLAIEVLQELAEDRVWFIPVLLTKGASVPDRGVGGMETLRKFQWFDLSEDWGGGIRSIVAVIYNIKPEDIDKKIAGGALRDGERDIYQLLLEDEDFTLSRSDKGSVLSVNFHINTKKITDRDRKAFIKSTIRDFGSRAESLQEELNNFLIKGVGPEPGKKGFKFRYASGGVLPILNIEGQDYYCLFYRDVDPVGWNIANGSTNTLTELLDPIETANRELCEELLIVNPEKRVRYVFVDDSGKLPDPLEFAVARRLWKDLHPKCDFPNFEVAEIHLRWQDGPDELNISTDLGVQRTISPCYLNINALDYGIEVDRIARLDVNKDDMLCDGEVHDGVLLNRVIGLFEVEGMNREVCEKTSFRPQKVFFDAEDRSSATLEEVIDEFTARIGGTPIRQAGKSDDFKIASHENRQYDLCPVTRGIIRRNTG